MRSKGVGSVRRARVRARAWICACAWAWAWACLALTGLVVGGQEVEGDRLAFAKRLQRSGRHEEAASEYETFLKDAPPGRESVDALFGAANARMHQGRYGEARKWFEEFLIAGRNDPRAGIARYRVGELSQLMGESDKALSALEGFVRDYPGHSLLDAGLRYVGEIRLSRGDWDGAEDAFERLLAESGEEGRFSDQARLGLARVWMARRDFDRARGTLRGLMESGDAAISRSAALQLGRLELAAERPSEALGILEGLERDAGDGRSALRSQSRLLRAEALRKLGREEDAAPLLRSLLEDGEGGVATRAAFDLGEWLLRGGNAEEALEVWEGALRSHPGSALGTALEFRAAEAMAELGRAEDAEKRFLGLAEGHPGDVWADDAVLRAAELALGRGDARTARRLGAGFEGRFPESPLKGNARLLEARAALASNAADEALAILDDLLEGGVEEGLSGEVERSARYQRALALARLDRTEEAAAEWRRIGSEPGNRHAAWAWRDLGLMRYRAGRYEEAAEAFDAHEATLGEGEEPSVSILAHQALSRAWAGRAEAAREALVRLGGRYPDYPQLATVRLSVGERDLASGRAEEAIESLRGAAEDDKAGAETRARAWLKLGEALRRTDRHGDAATAFGKALELAPEGEGAATAALGLGRSLELEGRTEEALGAYERLERERGDSAEGVEGRLARARLLARLGRAEEASSAYRGFLFPGGEEAPRAHGEADAATLEYAWTLEDSGRREDAERVLSGFLARSPGSPRAGRARLELGEMAFDRGDFEGCSEWLKPLVEGDSDAGGAEDLEVRNAALFRWGRARLELGDWEGAESAFVRLTGPGVEAGLAALGAFWRAEAMFSGGDSAGALEAFEGFLGSAGASSDAGLRRAAELRRLQALTRLERWREALEASDRFLGGGDSEGAAEARYAKGRALFGLARFEEAREVLRGVAEDRSAGELAAAAQFLTGETHFHQGRFDVAAREFLKVDLMHKAPHWQALALLEAGKAYERLERSEEAVRNYDEVLSRWPGHAAALEAAKRRLALRPGEALPGGAARASGGDSSKG